MTEPTNAELAAEFRDLAKFLRDGGHLNSSETESLRLGAQRLEAKGKVGEAIQQVLSGEPPTFPNDCCQTQESCNCYDWNAVRCDECDNTIDDLNWRFCPWCGSESDW
jgi:hypothetical protein